jgi:hypothetical protein
MMCCGGDGYGNGNGSVSDKVFVPKFHITHSPVGVASMSDVDDLMERGILVECDGKKIYELGGKAIGIVCSDPSLEECKIHLLNRGGEMSIQAKKAYGLRFDSKGPYGSRADMEVEEIQELIDTLGDHFGFKAIIFGSHGPCGGSGGLDLEGICRTVAAGACYLGRKTGLKVIPTIFINTEIQISRHLPPQNMLLWMYIKKEAIL